MSENRKKQTGKLYFFSDSRLPAWLKKGVLPLSTGVSLAEPFIHHDQWQSQVQVALAPEAVEKQWQLYYQALPEAVRGLLSFEHFREQGGAVEAEVHEAARRQGSDHIQGYDLGWLGQARYLRLFPSMLTYLAWQDAGDAFSGFAIGLESNHTGLTSTKERPSHLAPVVYGGPYRAKVTASNPFPGLLEDHPARRDNAEWRLLLMAKKVKQVEGVSVLPVPRGLVTGIYWSTHTPESQVDEVRHLVERDMRYRGVALGQVVPDERQWRLRLLAR